MTKGNWNCSVFRLDPETGVVRGACTGRLEDGKLVAVSAVSPAVEAPDFGAWFDRNYGPLKIEPTTLRYEYWVSGRMNKRRYAAEYLNQLAEEAA